MTIYYLTIQYMASMKTHNKHEIRDEMKKMLIDKIQLSEEDASELEIGVFNSTLDYANSLKIQLSWSCSLFTETYINNARSIYSNLKSDSYINNTHLYDRLKK